MHANTPLFFSIQGPHHTQRSALVALTTFTHALCPWAQGPRFRSAQGLQSLLEQCQRSTGFQLTTVVPSHGSY